MGIYDELRKQKQLNKSPVIKAKKKLHKGFLFGHISNGNGIVKLDEEYALKFRVIDNNFVEVFLLDYGKELTITPQTWQKTKIKEKETIKINIVEETEQEDLF